MSVAGAGSRGFPPRLWILSFALVTALAAAAAGVPERLAASIDAWSRLRNAESWTLGSHVAFGRDLHEALVAADSLLPREAGVLLVTPGRDLKRSEYIAFHRALYVLAPRPLWWAAPAKHDGSWESRWWSEVAPTPDAIVRRAREAGASHVLSFGNADWAATGESVTELAGGARLVAVSSMTARSRIKTEWRPAPAPAWVVGALGVILLAGWIVYAFLTARREPTSIFETVAMSWLLGCAVVSVAMFWMIRFGVSPGAQRISIAAASLAGALLVIRRRGFPGVQSRILSRDGKTRRFSFILTAALAVWLLGEIVGLLIRSAAGPLAGWDGWVTWAMKARVLHLQHEPAALLMDASREISNRAYPLLLPLTEAWIFGWIGGADDRFAAIVTMSFLMALLVLLFRALRPRVTLIVALAIVVAFVTSPYTGFLASLGYADIVLAAYALAGVLALRAWIENPDTSIRLTAALLGILPWVKTEGFILLAALLIGACVSVTNARPRLRLVGSTAIAALLCAGPWYLLVATSDISNTVFSRFPDVTANRAGVIIVGLASRAIAMDWHGLWLAAVAALFVIAVKRQWRTLLPIAISAYIGALGLSFFFSLYEPLAQHVLRSADRLLLHVAPLALLMIADVIASQRRASSATAAPGADHR